MFIATFVVISAFLIGMMANTISAESSGYFEINQGREIIGNVAYLFLDPEWGENITADDIRDTWKHDADESFFFEDAALTGDTIETQVIMDNTEYSASGVRGSPQNLYTDYIMFYTEWGWWSMDTHAVSFDQIMVNQVTDDNRSITQFPLHDGNYSLIVTADCAPDLFDVFIDLGLFTVRIALSEENTRDQTQDASMWTILRQLFTASLPNVTPTVNLLISTPFWASVGFLGVMIVRAFIPFLGG